MSLRRAFAAVSSFLLALVVAPPGIAQNLVVNPEFDSSVVPWTIGAQEFVVMARSPIDVDGSATSGSLSLESQTGWAYQCVPVTADTLYVLSGFVMPRSAGRSGTVNHGLELEWFSNSSCAGTSAFPLASLFAPAPLDVWTKLENVFASPSTAQSARVRLRNSSVSGGFATANFDSISMISQSELVNPEFDSSLVPWTIGAQEFVVMARSPIDVDGSPTSGSLSLESQTGWAYQCVPVTADTEYLLSGFVMPRSAGRSGTVNHGLELEWFSNSTCAGTSGLPLASIFTPAPLDVWTNFEDVFVSPSTARSARVRLRNSSISGGFATANFDSIFVPEPGGGASLVAGALGIAGLARRRKAGRLRAARAPFDID
jgi:hypothetical protein